MSTTVRERLAALAHEQWAGWMRHLFSRSEVVVDGSVRIPRELVTRWQRQVATPYADLPELEKDSDLAEADRVLALLAGTELLRELSAHDLTTLRRMQEFFETAPAAAPPFRGGLTRQAALVTLRRLDAVLAKAAA